jgi:hypothetical protein
MAVYVRKLVRVVLTAIIVWILLGILQSWVVSIRWETLPKGYGIPRIEFVPLVLVAIGLGLLIYTVNLLGGLAHSEFWILVGTALIGGVVGGVQGILIETDFWGYTALAVPLRSGLERIISGVLIGMFASVLIAAVAYFRRSELD